LIPEEAEDMWHAYNLLREGDSLRSSTIRKVTVESATGTTGSNRVRTTLTIAIEAVEYDTQGCVLRVKGRNIAENQYVKMGQYHTLDVELNRKFTLTKPYWDSVALDRLELACDPTQNADLGAVIMNEGEDWSYQLNHLVISIIIHFNKYMFRYSTRLFSDLVHDFG